MDWGDIHTAQNFKSLTTNEQDDFLNKVYNASSDKHYIHRVIKELILNNVKDINTLNKLAKVYFSNDSYYIEKYIDAIELFEILGEKKLKELVLTIPNIKKYYKLILCFKFITIEEEVLGLRSLSKSKYSLEKLNRLKYAPSLDALRELPTVMRLNSLEALTSIDYIGYNIFKHIPTKEDFEQLLFGSLLRHRNRVSIMMNKYIHIANLGIPHTVSFSCTCNNCGNYSVSFTSSVVSDIDSAKRLSKGYLYKSCSICGKWNVNITSDIKIKKV